MRNGIENIQLSWHFYIRIFSVKSQYITENFLCFPLKMNRGDTVLYDNVKKICEKKGISVANWKRTWNFQMGVSVNGTKVNPGSGRSRRSQIIWVWPSRSCWSREVRACGIVSEYSVNCGRKIHNLGWDATLRIWVCSYLLWHLWWRFLYCTTWVNRNNNCDKVGRWKSWK